MKSSVLVLFIAICISCNPEKSAEFDMNQLEWLEGEWINNSKEKLSCENWMKISDSIYQGEAFDILKNDTLFSEKISIKQIGNTIFYIPTVSDQNNGRPVYFKLISSKDQVLIFKNENHDFPQRIVYSNQISDSLHAYIDGEENGEFRKVEFKYKRRE